MNKKISTLYPCLTGLVLGAIFGGVLGPAIKNAPVESVGTSLSCKQKKLVQADLPT